MKRGPDDDALSWGDENDPTYVAPDLDDDEFDEPATEADQAAGADASDSRRRATVAASGPQPTAANETAVPTTRMHAGADATAAPPVSRSLSGADDSSAEGDTAQPLSSAALIAFGIFGGIFFLYTIGWLVGFLRNPPTGDGLGGIVQAVLSVLTLFAPALWFIATLSLGARRPVRTRILWLLIGVVLLVPWPFVTGY